MSDDKTGRSLLLRGRKAEVVLNVAADLWSTAERVRDDFKMRYTREPTIGEYNETELLLAFMLHTLSYVGGDTTESRMRRLLKELFLSLHVKFLKGAEPHNCLQGQLETMEMREALRIYYDVLVVLQSGVELKDLQMAAAPNSALLGEVAAGRAKILGIFGGQGNTENLLEELVELDYIYQPLCRSFMKAVSAGLLRSASEPEAQEYLTKGFDIMRWVDDPDSRPPREYLFSAAVSLPLVGLIQLVNYYITCRILDLTPGELRATMTATTGHSQGIVAAAVIASSSTEAELVSNTGRALQALFWIGLRSIQAFPLVTLDPKIQTNSLINGDSMPTPMLAVTNMTLTDLQQQVDVSNRFLAEGEKIEIALHNGPRAFVCSGPPKSLHGLDLLLRKLRADPMLDQAKIPFSERKLRFTTKFLPISSPFHCDYLKNAVDRIMDDINREDLALKATSFAIPVIATDTGLAVSVGEGLMKSLIEQICVKPVYWMKAVTAHHITHILDFGPGNASGIGALTHRNIDGSGIQVVLAGTVDTPISHLQSRKHLYGSTPESVRYGTNWAEKYQPRLVKNRADGQIYVDTPFSQLLGKQPLMVAGMTPSTIDADFVAACLNAGYHVELSGGGHFTEQMLRDKINLVLQKIAPGHGVSLNSLFINQRLWSFQFPLVQVMRREGTPIEGFTVAAGVPSLEVATEIITALKAAGIRHVSFKPGSVEGIMQVVNIAKQNPDYPIILQWTGGRAGGHHSYEDFHQPILDTYSLIRSCENIILVAGSGFGDGIGTYPYIEGTWSKAYDYPPMPFDGVLLGSRVMVAKEGKASRSVKETIAAVAGVEDERDWVQSYKGAVGGVITVISELGEPIHKIATRGVLLWKDLDETVFRLPREKRLAWLIENKTRIIQRLNQDSHKVWFGRNSKGEVVDLVDMTYAEVLQRLGELLYVSHQKRWIDSSLRRLFFEMLQRAEERLIKVPGPSCVPSSADLQREPNIDPLAFLAHLRSSNEELDLDQLMSSEDCSYFVALCIRVGQKPVPFIPIFDENFEAWFKRDSLWQSEDIDAVVGQDPQRVCILQGPVSVKHCKKIDEPVKDILDGIISHHVKMILATRYQNDESQVPTVCWFGGPIHIPAPLEKEKVLEDLEIELKGLITLPHEGPMPNNHELFTFLVGGRQTWVAALLLSADILQGQFILPNSVRKLFNGRPGFTYCVDNHFDPQKLRVEDAAGRQVVEARLVAGCIEIDFCYHSSQGPANLKLLFKFVPTCPNIPLHEIMEGRNERVKAFYWTLWFQDSQELPSVLAQDPLTAKFTTEGKIEAASLKKFCRIVGNNAPAYSDTKSGALVAPMDYAIVVAWRSVIKCLFPSQVDGDLLRLVHLSNRIAYVDGATPLKAGQVVESTARVSSITMTPTGKIVEVIAEGNVQGSPVFKVASRFMFRGRFDKTGLYFERGHGLTKKLMVQSTEALAVLRSKVWINWATDKAVEAVKVGSTILICLDYFHRQDVARNVLKAIECQGQVLLQTDTKEFSQIGVISFSARHPMKANPVLHYLERHSYPLDEPTLFPQGSIPIAEASAEMALTSSSSNQAYSDISGDHNPIHTDPLIADLVDLPGTITHGLWTTAAVRALVETYAAENQPLRVREYEATFTEMVLPNDTLRTRLTHVGMKAGRKLIRLETTNQAGKIVLSGVAQVEQPRTAYLFTGQGSQEVGMGMDLYAISPVARAIWDHADEYYMEKYGFSIIQIIRNNPVSLTVYFGGPKGQKIRETYLSMTYEQQDANGVVSSVALFPQINEDSTFYTFQSPNGLLNATQFTQPALTLMERAAFEDMKARGLVGVGCAFAGHSLGEYAALAAVGDVLCNDSLCDVVFYRGLAMQVVVERDRHGRSCYGMVAVNPARVGRGFNDKALRSLVPLIAAQSGTLLEIVNYNVENWQYVVAGDLVALETLAGALNHISAQKLNASELLIELNSGANCKQRITGIIHEALVKSREKEAILGYLKLERGVATIPLAGIDVPFHSSFLLGGVQSFRKCLDARLKLSLVDATLLCGKYIPNLTGEPFNTTLEYVQRILKRCDSPVLKALVSKWREPDNAGELQRLTRTILIELLAYQFASPVNWIETQDVLFRDFAIERLIEIGPAPVLTSMAERTLKFKYQEYDDALNQSRTLWTYLKNKAEIYYEYVPKTEPGSQVGTDNSSKSFTPPPTKTSPTSNPVESKVQSSNVALSSPTLTPLKRFEDIPLEVEELVRMLVALKTKKSLDEVQQSKSIKDLSGGKSTLQNEILADLQKEFGDRVPERAEELPLRDLGLQLRPAYTRQLGRLTSSLLGKLFSSKMPAGLAISGARELLSREFGLEARAADQLLMYSLHMEPPNRFTDEDAAKTWLREVAKKFFATHSLELPSGDSASSQSAIATISSVELEKIQQKHRRLLRQQIELFAAYVEQNLLEFRTIADDRSAQLAVLQKDLDLWLAEFSVAVQDGVKPQFSGAKARRYDSSWNWARQDVFALYHDIIFGRLVNVDRCVTAKCLHVMNRASTDLIEFMEYYIRQKEQIVLVSGVTSDSLALAQKYGELLISQVREALVKPPVYRDLTIHTRPQVTISYDGSIEYSEVRRAGVSNYEAYVRELYRGSEALRRFVPTSSKDQAAIACPLLYIRTRAAEDHTRWEYNAERTDTYFEALTQMATTGVSFEGKTALATGCGRGSIGCEVVKGLLSGGAKVIITTSSFTRSTVDFFRAIYESHGARSSCLIIAPFNQGSTQDLEALIAYIYGGDKVGLGWDLDYVIPFAAITEAGREMTNLDGRTELAHRIMLTNVLRLVGLVAETKRSRRILTRPAQVILPLSPNHGIFGGDGLYGESKRGLETLLNRWHAEDWGDYLSVAGAVIGWTRGTGLMNDNNLIAEEMERAGLRTFSANEMAFNILGLMHPRMVRLAEAGPIYGDLNGGLDAIQDLAAFTRTIRKKITDEAQVKRAMSQERSLEAGFEMEPVERVPTVRPRAHLLYKYPELPATSDSLPGDPRLTDLLDLSRVVVVTGFSEVGPWGNSRTRWEMEATGELSLEGCVEMAWLMGLVRYHNGVDANGAPYTGWVDAKSGSPVADYDIKAQYEEKIMAHSGIRFIEPELFDGYDPSRKTFCQEIAIDYDMSLIEVNREEAEAFKLQHGDKADVYANGDSWCVRLKRGATIFVPKALRFDRLVAGQIPTGWSAERYGIPKEIIEQVDPITLYVLVSTVEALVAAGITDPYEFYQYVHLSEVGNTTGGGEGGVASTKKMYVSRFLDSSVQADIMQESFINTMPAWVNMLLLSSSGPIKTPVGACATAVESVEIGVDTIQSGKARVVLVGGYDDFQEESSYEFAQMKATSSATDEAACGRQPDEMSRPMATSRSGFMESQGAGVQVLMTAELALEMGCPIYGIIALTNTATDKEGRSVPAPGQGILTTARSVRPTSYTPRALDMGYRHDQLKKGLGQVKDWLSSELEELAKESQEIGDKTEKELFIKCRARDIELEGRRREQKERQLWGLDFWKADPRIAPIEGALATYGLTINDVGVASFHGTGTKANDLNESEVVNKQLSHLGRARGNPLPCICQKYLTGHPKGAAAAWMLNGVLQVLNTGIIPGNRNADNIDERLSEFNYLLYLSRSIYTTGVKAGLLKSFGFGQVGGEVLVIHPHYLLRAVQTGSYTEYLKKRAKRQAGTFRYLHDSLVGVAPLIQVKNSPPYPASLESTVYLNPEARAQYDTTIGSWNFRPEAVEQAKKAALQSQGPGSIGNLLQTSMAVSAEGASQIVGVGVDVQVINELAVSADNKEFIHRNYSLSEQEYCQKQPNPMASLAGRWAGKEAVVKALCNAAAGFRPIWLQGGAGALLAIEILPDVTTGAPLVTLHGDAIHSIPVGHSIKLSISHSGAYAVAVAVISK